MAAKEKPVEMGMEQSDTDRAFDEKPKLELCQMTTTMSASHMASSLKERVKVALARDSSLFWRQAIRPIRMLRDPTVVLVSLYCAMIFGWAVGVTLISKSWS